MKIYNSFGIKPTNSFTSAGSDYYVPNIKTTEQEAHALVAFEKSYKKTTEEIHEITDLFIALSPKEYKNNIVNLIHLYLALYSPMIEEAKYESLGQSIIFFLKYYVIYDEEKDVVGLKMQLNDTLFINSGIKIALDTVLSKHVAPKTSNAVDIMRLLGIGVAGLYVNKSGNGNKGWDIRACLVDEDYAGFVHLSMAYTKNMIEDGQNIVYCGDKLTQMMLIPVFHDEYEEINQDEYESIMANSQRGDSGFGSQDVKH